MFCVRESAFAYLTVRRCMLTDILQWVMKPDLDNLVLEQL